MAARLPRIYLDTNILLDLFFQRRPESTGLVLRGTSESWDVTYSHFALMELIDIVQETYWAQRKLNEDRDQLNVVISQRHTRDLPIDALERIRRQIRQFTDSLYPHIGYYDFANPGILERAMGLCENTNMTAPDCIHVQMALEIGVDLFVTRDGHVIREADAWVPTASPDAAVRRLIDLGFALQV